MARYRPGDKVTIGGKLYRLEERLGARDWRATGPDGPRGVSEQQFDAGCEPSSASVERGAGSNLDREGLAKRAHPSAGAEK